MVEQWQVPVQKNTTTSNSQSNSGHKTSSPFQLGELNSPQNSGNIQIHMAQIPNVLSDTMNELLMSSAGQASLTYTKHLCGR